MNCITDIDPKKETVGTTSPIYIYREKIPTLNPIHTNYTREICTMLHTKINEKFLEKCIEIRGGDMDMDKKGFHVLALAHRTNISNAN